MTMRFTNVALIGKYQSPDVAESVLLIARYLRERGLEVWLAGLPSVRCRLSASTSGGWAF